MGRCGGWIKILALVLVTFLTSCGGTGGGPSDSGKPFVFEGRGRLNLIAQPVITTPTVLTVIATLLDPQGNPFRNQRVTFEAEFPDATIVPANTPQNVPLACLPPGSNGNATRCTNRGAAITNDLGQAQVTVIAGLTLGSMRVTAEAPTNLNISSAISVRITSQGFIGGTALAILPTSVTFINPLVKPGTDGPFTIFSAVGGVPPYRWDNTDKDLARIDPQGIPNINEKAKYTLIGPIPTTIPEVLNDLVTLIDSRGTRVTAPVTVIFASCTLRLSANAINFQQARPGDTLDIKILDGVPPFTISHTFPPAGILTVTDDGTITYTIPDPVFSVSPDGVIVRDSRGCVGTFNVTITPATVETLVLAAAPADLPDAGGDVVITAIAFDIDNQPFEGVTIVFTTTLGTLSSNTAVTDADGKATVTLPVGNNPGTDAGATPPTSSPRTITVTATASDGKTATVDIIQE
jgi:hypothetical protein